MHVHSIVIGRQGEMINKLQAESSARIQVAPGTDMHGPESDYACMLYCIDGSEVNGLRAVSICGTPETVE